MKGRGWRAAALTGVLALGGALQAAGSPEESAASLSVTATLNSTRVPRHEVVELTFQHDGQYANPFFDVSIEVELSAPSGRAVRVGGFHYGSSQPPRIEWVEGEGRRRRPRYHFDKQDLWRARFAPDEGGTWRYSWVFRNAKGQQAEGEGTFECVEGRAPAHGFVRQSPSNPFRWVFDDGTPYFPVGLQECLGDGSGTGSVLDAASLEGPFRTDRTDLVQLLPGPLYVRGPSYNPQNADVYFRRYGRAGFDLFRFSQSNCSYDLYDDLDHYRVQEGVMTDELLQHARRYGLRVMYGLFGYQAVFSDDLDNAEGMAKVKRFAKYSADRWGAYVDVWEFLNEQDVPEAWYRQLVPYLRQVDPYGHPIATSWERPQLEGIDVNAPHDYYGSLPEPDLETARRAAQWKAFGKPVVVGEHGNSVEREREKRPPGHGGVWYAESAERMRVRNWTALFSEIAFVFWNTSYARDGHYMNLWLGPREREYVRAMQDFAYRLDAGVRPAPVTVSQPASVRAYGLASATRAAAYLVRADGGNRPVTDLTVTLQVPQAGTAYWYAPEDAAVRRRVEVGAGEQDLVAPPFAVDLALLVTPDGPPDLDLDGAANDADLDDDGDGVPDEQDAFPLESEEWADADGDLIGDNLDADVDGDGVGDDLDGNGVADHEELDRDGDGVPRAKAVPWDAFPLDRGEWRDTDGDGLGDNGDPDDDGDGWTDAEEVAAGTQPQDRLSFP